MLYGTTPPVPREARPRLARRPAAARRVRARRRGRRGARAGLRSSRRRPTLTRPHRSRRGLRASGCRRCWPSAGFGSRRALRGADRRRPGAGQRRGRRARPAGRSRRRPRRGRRRARRHRGPVSSTTCSTSRPASSPRPTTPQGRPTVVDLVPAEPRVFPVGRLDADTEGLLLLTNDGDLTHRLTHPSFGVEKEYLAEVEGAADAGRAAHGCATASSSTTASPRRRRSPLVEPTCCGITIHEGRNRQVRRMCEAVGHPVVRLVRTRIGPIADRRLTPGEWRPLTHGRGARPRTGRRRDDPPTTLSTDAAPFEPCAARPRSTRDEPEHITERVVGPAGASCSSATASTTTTSSASSSRPPTTSTRCSRPPRRARSGSATCRSSARGARRRRRHAAAASG